MSGYFYYLWGDYKNSVKAFEFSVVLPRDLSCLPPANQNNLDATNDFIDFLWIA